MLCYLYLWRRARAAKLMSFQHWLLLTNSLWHFVPCPRPPPLHPPPYAAAPVSLEICLFYYLGLRRHVSSSASFVIIYFFIFVICHSRSFIKVETIQFVCQQCHSNLFYSCSRMLMTFILKIISGRLGLNIFNGGKISIFNCVKRYVNGDAQYWTGPLLNPLLLFISSYTSKWNGFTKYPIDFRCIKALDFDNILNSILFGAEGELWIVTMGKYNVSKYAYNIYIVLDLSINTIFTNWILFIMVTVYVCQYIAEVEEIKILWLYLFNSVFRVQNTGV